jgi:lactate dehydrogenase-like 2-hydroxyacid dehydrogenase
MSTSAKVFVSFPVLPQVREHISSRCSADFNETNTVLSSVNLINRARGHDTLMVTVTDALDCATIQRLPEETRVIATYSVGHNHVDLDAAAARGIAVINTPGVLTDAVAELAFFLMIGAARRATESIDLIRAGRWTGWTSTQLPGMQLAGKRLGIYGMGRIGQAVAQRARAFGMSIHYTNTRRLEPQLAGDAIYHADAQELLRCSDVLLLACPATPETRGFLDRRRIEALPDGAIVINVSRGDVVDDDSLIRALATGKLAAAGLDVFANEPGLDPRYFNLANVLMTPHIGSSTIEARVSMAAALLDALEELARGSNPRNRLV